MSRYFGGESSRRRREPDPPEEPINPSEHTFSVESRRNLEPDGSEYRYRNGILVDSRSEVNDWMDRVNRIILDTPVYRPRRSRRRSRPSQPIDPQFDIEDDIDGPCTKLFSSFTLLAGNGEGSNIPIRALLHLKVEKCYITESCRRRLHLPLMSLDETIDGEILNRNIIGKTVLSIAPNFNPNRKFPLMAMVLEMVLIRSPWLRIHPAIKDEMSNFKLADPDFDIPAPVDLIFGSEVYTRILKDKPYFRITTNCYAQKCRLGWVIYGEPPISELQYDEWEENDMYHPPERFDSNLELITNN